MNLPPAIQSEIASYLTLAWRTQELCRQACDLQQINTEMHDVCRNNIYDAKLTYADTWGWSLLRRQCVYEDWRRTLQRLAFLPPLRPIR